MNHEVEIEERQTGIYRLLRIPSVYTAAMRCVTGPDVLGAWVDHFVRPTSGMRILDVGSGTSSILSNLGDVRYYGIEPNASYVETARRRWGERGTFQVGVIQNLVTMTPESFDLVLAVGVLHHVSDSDAKTFFEAGTKLLTRGGRIVTLDGAYTPGQTRLAKLVVSRDRGAFVRGMEAYTALALSSGLQVRTFYTNRMLRIPYSHVTIVAQSP